MIMYSSTKSEEFAMILSWKNLGLKLRIDCTYEFCHDLILQLSQCLKHGTLMDKRTLEEIFQHPGYRNIRGRNIHEFCGVWVTHESFLLGMPSTYDRFTSIPQKSFPQNVYFLPICGSFLPRKELLQLSAGTRIIIMWVQKLLVFLKLIMVHWGMWWWWGEWIS